MERTEAIDIAVSRVIPKYTCFSPTNKAKDLKEAVVNIVLDGKDNKYSFAWNVRQEFNKIAEVEIAKIYHDYWNCKNHKEDHAVHQRKIDWKLVDDQPCQECQRKKIA